MRTRAVARRVDRLDRVRVLLSTMVSFEDSMEPALSNAETLSTASTSNDETWEGTAAGAVGGARRSAASTGRGSVTTWRARTPASRRTHTALDCAGCARLNMANS